jgi:toxin HigB-1
MIKSFNCKETEKVFHGHFSAKLPQSIQRTAAMKLKMLNAATVMETLRIPPSNYLEALPGDREGQHSIRINNGASVLSGKRIVPAMSRSSITTER